MFSLKRPKIFIKSFFPGIIVLLLLAVVADRVSSNGILPTPTPTNVQTPTPVATPKRDVYKVTRVIDGDTVELTGGVKVRYIGIDAPESTILDECFGKQSSAKNKELVEGKEVRLEKDVSETDKFGRLLRYVYVGDLFINEVLVKEGFANASTYPPDIAFQETFRKAEVLARENNLGLWSMCTPDVMGTGNAFSDKDCKDFKTQAEAQAFFEAAGGGQNDPHKLDPDKDGKVCENLQ